jgi:flagellar basal body-associated protein FliL
MGDNVDDGTVVANLVYGGTLMIGGVMLLILSVSLVITLLLAGVAQTMVSIAKLGAKVFVYRPVHSTAEATATDHVRSAVVAKADAILAAARTEAPARAKAPAERAPLTLAYSDRTGPFTGTQPLVKAG